MVQQEMPDTEVVAWLKTQGIASLCQWDLLVFFYRHQSSLVGTDDLARLLGYATEAVLTALGDLEAEGLIGRSRVSQGARMYQLTVPADSPCSGAFARLLALSIPPAGRLRLAKQLRRDDQRSAQRLQGVRHVRGQTLRVARIMPRSLKNPEKRAPWLKAI